MNMKHGVKVLWRSSMRVVQMMSSFLTVLGYTVQVSLQLDGCQHNDYCLRSYLFYCVQMILLFWVISC